MPTHDRRSHRFVVLALAVAAALPACTVEDERPAGPPINPGISNSAGPVAGELVLTCEGPDDELELLAGLCDAPTTNTAWSHVDVDGGDGIGVKIGAGPYLLVYAQADADLDDEALPAALAYSAYVHFDPLTGSFARELGRWRDGEAVTSGEVRTESATFNGCTGPVWAAEATFLWRATTVRVRWAAIFGC